MHTIILLAGMMMVGCGGPATTETEAAPGFPNIANWGGAVHVVHDDEAQTSREIFRSADGRWAKVHHPLRRLDVTTRIDMRTLTPGAARGGWTYTSWDPARRAPIELAPAEAETCHLCHSLAPSNGTYTLRER